MEFATTRGCNGFDGGVEARIAGGVADSRLNLVQFSANLNKLKNNDNVVLAAA